MTQQQPTGRTDNIGRFMEAPAAVIYQALIDPQAIITWRVPEGMKGRIDHFEAVEGGTYKMTLTYLDKQEGIKGKTTEQEDSFEGRFLQLVPNEKVVEAVVFESDDPAFAGTMQITTTLLPFENGTEVKMVFENVPPGISEEDHYRGISAAFDNLAEYVEK